MVVHAGLAVAKGYVSEGHRREEGKECRTEHGRQGGEGGGQESSQEWEMRNTARMSAPDLRLSFFFWFTGFVRKPASTRERRRRQRRRRRRRRSRWRRRRRGEAAGRRQGLTLHPLFALALLSVLLLEFGYQALVHIPGLRVLLVLVYTGKVGDEEEEEERTKPDQEAVEELPWSRSPLL